MPLPLPLPMPMDVTNGLPPLKLVFRLDKDLSQVAARADGGDGGAETFGVEQLRERFGYIEGRIEGGCFRDELCLMMNKEVREPFEN